MCGCGVGGGIVDGKQDLGLATMLNKIGGILICLGWIFVLKWPPMSSVSRGRWPSIIVNVRWSRLMESLLPGLSVPFAPMGLEPAVAVRCSDVSDLNISSLLVDFLSRRGCLFTHSHVRFAIMGESFTHSPHSREYIHRITRIQKTKFQPCSSATHGVWAVFFETRTRPIS